MPQNKYTYQKKVSRRNPAFTTTAGSDKLKALARVGVFSTAITKFN